MCSRSTTPLSEDGICALFRTSLSLTLTMRMKTRSSLTSAQVEGFGFTWGAFVNAINKKITNEQSGDDISSFEDKQIGMWFVKAPAKEGAEGKIISKEIFLHKVVEYLFDDVFKLDTTQIFTENSLSLLIEKAYGDNPLSIFANGIVSSIEAEQKELDLLKENARLG